MVKRKRVHRFVVTVVLDKYCSPSIALAILKDNFQDHIGYPTARVPSDPESIKLRSFSRLTAGRK